MDKRQLDNIINIVKVLHDVHPDMNARMMLAFFEVAKDGGVTGTQLEARYGMTQATAARLLRFLSKWQTRGKPGLDLLRVEVDPFDYKAKLRFLNERGEEVINEIDKAYNGRA